MISHVTEPNIGIFDLQFADIIDLLPDPIFAIDLQGTVIVWNPAIVELTGIKSEDILGKCDYEYAIPFYGARRPILIDLVLDWDEDIAKLYKHIKKHNGTLTSEIDNLSIRQESYYLWKTARGLYNSTGDCIGAIEVIRDITEQKQTEEKLRKALELERQGAEEFQTIMDLVPAAVWLSHDAKCHHITGNQYANRLFLAEQNENISAGPGPELRNRSRRFFRDNKELMPDELPMQRAAAWGIDIRNYELDVLLSNKETRTLLGNASPLFDQEGRVRGCVGAFLDITDRKKFEEDLKQSHQRFQAMIQAIPSFTFESDAEGNYTFVSEQWCTYTGMFLEQTAGSGWIRALHPDDTVSVLKRWSESIRTGKMFHSKHRLQLKDGSYRWFIGRSLPVKNAEGEIVRWTGLLTDIDDLVNIELVLRNRERELETLNEKLELSVKERTAQLEKRNQEISELAHKTIQAMENERKALSKELHDSIGGTLAAIKYQLEGRVERMGQPPQDVCMPIEKINEYLGIAITESRRITKQLRPSVLDDFGLAAAIAECIRDFETFHPKIKVERRISIAAHFFSNDTKTVIYRVLQEALNNVGKHSQANLVDIRIRRYKCWVRLKVKDNGIGFDDSVVFASTNVMNGYGLHSMKERVEICKGKFCIRSTPGNGTTIIASIPIESIQPE